MLGSLVPMVPLPWLAARALERNLRFLIFRKGRDRDIELERERERERERETGFQKRARIL